MSGEPIVVLYKSSMCHHCATISNIWDTPPSKGEDSIVLALKKVYPKIRVFTITAKDNTGIFNENTAPKDIIRYNKWYPMILLIPGKLWDFAMSRLGPKNDVQLIDGVQVMNGIWEGTELKHKPEYDLRKPSEFGRWLRNTLEDEKFKKSQNQDPPNFQKPSQNPIGSPQSPIIQPFITNVRPNNKFQGPDNNEVCSWRVISRPK